MMILAKEPAILKAEEEFQNMIEMAKQAADKGVMIHEVEGGSVICKSLFFMGL